MSEEKNPKTISPMASTSRDMKQLKKNSSSAAIELREFLAEMRGKSPKEMLGRVAQSSLVMSLVGATVIFAIMIAFGTVVPFGMAQLKAVDTEALAAKMAADLEEKAAAAAEQPEETSAEKGVAAAKPDEEKPPKESAPDDLLNRLGVGEEKVAPLDVNPLENAQDDLFNDLE